VTVVPLGGIKVCDWGIAAFIFNIFAGLSGQLRDPAALDTGKYSPIGLAVESSSKWVYGGGLDAFQKR
jgi:hypothetical protein